LIQSQEQQKRTDQKQTNKNTTKMLKVDGLKGRNLLPQNEQVLDQEELPINFRLTVKRRRRKKGCRRKSVNNLNRRQGRRLKKLACSHLFRDCVAG